MRGCLESTQRRWRRGQTKKLREVIDKGAHNPVMALLKVDGVQRLVLHSALQVENVIDKIERRKQVRSVYKEELANRTVDRSLVAGVQRDL